MKSILVTAAMAAALAGSTLAAKADTTIGFPTSSGALYTVGKGPFNMAVATFTTTSAAVLDGISASTTSRGLTFSSDSLYLGSSVTGSALFTNPESGRSFSDLLSYNLAANTTYTIAVGGTGPGSFNGSYTLGTVPLPTSVALFGGAIAALGVAGAVRRKMSTTA